MPTSPQPAPQDRGSQTSRRGFQRRAGRGLPGLGGARDPAAPHESDRLLSVRLASESSRSRAVRRSVVPLGLGSAHACEDDGMTELKLPPFKAVLLLILRLLV